MTRFSSNIDRSTYLVSSIVQLANHTTTLAVDTAVEAARAELDGNQRRIAEEVSRLAVASGVATGEIAWLAHELEISQPLDVEIATAGVAITGLQASLLAIAGAVQDVADAGGPAEAYSAAGALRNAALSLDELLSAYQPS